MSGSEFIHLHVHSYYSFFDSAMPPEEIVSVAKAQGARAVAMTDTNNFTGAVTFYKAARSAGVKPIIGAEVTQPLPHERQIVASRVPENYSAEAERGGEGRARGAGSISPALCHGDRSRRIVLLARNFDGYSEISHILTRRNLNSDFDLFAEVAQLTANVVGFTDSLEVLRAAAEVRVPHMYAMLVPSRRRRRANRAVYELAKSLGVPLVIACDAKIATREDAPLHTLLQAMRRLTTIYQVPEQEQLDPAQCLQTGKEIAAFFGLGGSDDLHADLREAYHNTVRIAKMCECDLPLGEWKFLRFKKLRLPPQRMLRELVERGLRERYGTPAPAEAVERMNYELSVIEKLRFTEYFLLVNRIVEEAWARGFNIIGRGSAANSIVSYALRFTNVCPLRYNLYFERFLNPERNVPPDIDIDFSWRERDDMIKWCFDFFGHENVALISTIQTLQARQAIREVAKAHGIAENEVNAFNRLHETRFNVADGDGAKTRVHNLADEEPWRTILQQAQRLTDFPRHLSIHCGGIIIAPRNVVDFVPLTTSAKGFVITQMDMYGVEDMGLIKIDMLSNRSLGVLKDTLEMVQRNQERRERELRMRDRRGVIRAGNDVHVHEGQPALGKQRESRTDIPVCTAAAERLNVSPPTVHDVHIVHDVHHVHPPSLAPRRDRQECLSYKQGEVFRREAQRMKLAGTRRGTSVALAGILMPGVATPRVEEDVSSTITSTSAKTTLTRDPCVSLIRKRVFDFEYVTNDPATRALIDCGRTMGCFYIESPGMRALFERLRCKNFDEVVAASSIIRPGVAESGMMQEYITRHQGDSSRQEQLTRETQRAGLPGSRQGARVAIALDLQKPPSPQLPPDPRSPTTLIPHGTASERLATGIMPINAHAKSRPIASDDD